jgi:hypothetical protein
MVQTWWQKLTANERMAATGAVVVFIVSLLSGGWIAVIGAGAVLAVYWLKYSPNQITWPAPVELINLVIAGILGLFALVGVLALISMTGMGFGLLGIGGSFLGGGIYLLVVAAAIAFIVGAGMMVLGTWREYQAMPKTAAPTAPSAPSTPPPPPAAQPPPPSTPPSEPPTA